MLSKWSLAVVALLLVLSPVRAEPVLYLNLLIGNNTTLLSEHVAVIDGKILPIQTTGFYLLKIIDAQGRIAAQRRYSNTIIMSSNAPSKSQDLLIIDQIPYQRNMQRLLLFYQQRFMTEIPLDFCNHNALCELGENTLSCEDCNATSKDGLCLPYIDGICDPDCTSVEDKDCSLCNHNNKCDSGEKAGSCSDCLSAQEITFCQTIKDGVCDQRCPKDVDCFCGDGICQPFEQYTCRDCAVSYCLFLEDGVCDERCWWDKDCVLREKSNVPLQEISKQSTSDLQFPWQVWLIGGGIVIVLVLIVMVGTDLFRKKKGR
ncbi:hypothetical protein HZB02_04115 [Candidatus Woesearchaeota archaeon]|nr:hypothetical protein [Candidatus Woesearchaeota archaeon]